MVDTKEAKAQALAEQYVFSLFDDRETGVTLWNSTVEARKYENECSNLHIVAIHCAKVLSGRLPIRFERSVLEHRQQKFCLVFV
jgi:hypothetical protein